MKRLACLLAVLPTYTSPRTPSPRTGPSSAARPAGHSRGTAAADRMGPTQERRLEDSRPRQGLVVAGRRRRARVYLTTAVADATAKRPVAAGAVPRRGAPARSSGTSRCSARTAARRRAIHTKNSHASPTPVVDGDRLYVHFGHQGTACLDLDGKVLWTQHRAEATPRSTATAARRSWSTTCSSSACDGGDKQFVVALDARDRQGGVEDAARAATARKKLLVQHAAGRSTSTAQKQIVSPGSDVVVAYDPETGKEIWRVQLRRLLGHPAAGVRARPGVPQHRLRHADAAGDPARTARAT